MTTKKLYQKDVYKKEGFSAISELFGEGTATNPFQLVLEETIFFPTGGGQPCDLGTINGAELTDVYEKDGKIFHKLLPALSQSQNSGDESPSSGTAWQLGQKVQCRLNWQRRFEHMQRHCGEHILSGIFFRECGGVNRGFHMGKDYMTIDIDVPGITWETAQRIELLTNEVIWSNVPVTTRYFEDRSEAEKLPLRKALAIDEDITIVCVGSEENPSDCVACCGTHPSTSGQVGLLKILKLESYKGMTRVYFKAGKETLLDFQNKHQILTELNQKYSSEDSGLLDKIKVQEEKNKEVRHELYQLKNAFLAKTTNEILKDAGIPDSNVPKAGDNQTIREKQNAGIDFTSSSLVIREYPYFQVNDLLQLTKVLVEKTSNLFILISTKENTVILASSGKTDCGKIVKDNANVWNGKGGGNAANARALFPSRDDLECFVTFIKQAYGTTKQ